MILPRHSAGILHCDISVPLGLPVRSLHVLQQVTDGVDVGTGQVIALSLDLGSCRVGPPDGKWRQQSQASPLTGLGLL